ncbi:MAG: Jag N-terminal domain-containing protein [Oscillospiraceae bacterium]|nr:Jag N-terminal domain-containing protein [Candidatus Equicaccousia limihippi]
MLKEAIGTGDTIEKATDNALQELNAGENDNVQIEVLETPKKRLFGGTPAKVRAYFEAPDEETPKTEKKPTAKAGKAKDTDAKSKEKSIVNFEEKSGTPYKELDPQSKAGKAANYIAEILTCFGCTDIELLVSDIEGGSLINISGEGLGAIIGHRGETLDALQHLSSLASNVGQSGYYRVVLNTGDYRERREQTLIALANRMSQQAINAHKCRTLEPMNPYERRIIHTAVQKIDGVTSTSFGEGDARRVVIAPDGVTPRPRNESRGDQRNFKRGRSTHDRKPKYVPQVQDHEQLKDSADTPLYGKIEL